MACSRVHVVLRSFSAIFSPLLLGATVLSLPATFGARLTTARTGAEAAEQRDASMDFIATVDQSPAEGLICG